jgi:hypothetical protein
MRKVSEAKEERQKYNAKEQCMLFALTNFKRITLYSLNIVCPGRQSCTSILQSQTIFLQSQRVKISIAAEDIICRVKFHQSSISGSMLAETNICRIPSKHPFSFNVQRYMSAITSISRVEWQCFPSGQSKSGLYHSRSCRIKVANVVVEWK